VQDRYFFETSMLVELHLQRVPVRDVLMPARYVGDTSSMELLPISLEFSGRLLKAFARRIALEYVLLDFRPASVFALAGALLTAFGGAFGAFHWIESSVTGNAATAGTVMVAALPFLVGVQLLLQAIVLDIGEVRNFPPLAPLDSK